MGKAEKKLLREILEYIERSEKGRVQVTEGKLYDDAPSAIGAHERVLAIMDHIVLTLEICKQLLTSLKLSRRKYITH